MQIRTSDGIRLDAHSVGSGPPLVFAHEFSSDARSWDLQVGFLSRYYRCTVYCARGYPPSDVPAAVDAYDQIRAAEDLADVVRAVCDEPAHVIGLSMGGFAAIHFGLRHPQLARSLVVAGVGYGAKPDQQSEHGISARREADRAEAIGMAAFAGELAASSYAQSLRAKDESGWNHFAHRLAGHCVTGMAMTLRGVLARRPSLWHLADQLRSLDRPVLLVVGDEDTPCLEPNLFLKATLPDAALCVIRAQAHCSIWKNRRFSTQSYFGFLAAVERGRWREWRGGKWLAQERER